jgi:hypothetical protein
MRNCVRIVDVTGEGLPDFLKCDTAGQCKAWINTGSGWKLNDNWKPPIAISHWNDSGNFDTGVRIVDVSGDGLPDFLKCRVIPMRNCYWWFPVIIELPT